MRERKLLSNDTDSVDLSRLRPSRRSFLRQAVAGTAVFVLGGWYLVSRAETHRLGDLKRPDGRPRLPPGQSALVALRPMGGEPGDFDPRHLSLRIYGEVDEPLTLSFADLLALPQVEQVCDVHCVTGWSLLDASWTGVSLRELAARARVKASAHYVVFEAAHGYTANVPLKEALAPNVLLAHRHRGQPLPRAHGAPIRALVPDLYFWKSAKYLTGVRFVRRDEPGYWETRGYHNHADPWREERYG